MVEATTSPAAGDSERKLRIAIIGASGAVGREITEFAKNNDQICELILLVRRALEEWQQEDFTPKLTLLMKTDFESFDDVKEQLRGVDLFICTLGSQAKYGREVFRRVDYEYPLRFAQLAKELNVPHYSLLTSAGANANSCFNYLLVKGEVERDVRALGLAHLTIYQPGLIKNRRNDDRCGEKCFGCLPCVTSIQAAHLGESILLHAIEAVTTKDNRSDASQNVVVLSNA